MKSLVLAVFIGLVCGLVQAGLTGGGYPDVRHVRNMYQPMFARRFLAKRMFNDIPTFDDYGDYGSILM